MTELLSKFKGEFNCDDRGGITLKASTIKFNYLDSDGKKQAGELSADYVFCQGFKSQDKKWFTSVMKMITYPGLMILKGMIQFELVPFADGGYYRFEAPSTVMVQVKAQGVVWPVCGEALPGTLKSSMKDYPATMAVKRAVARAILQASGLYSEGFYSEDECPPEKDVQQNGGGEAAPPTTRSRHDLTVLFEAQKNRLGQDMSRAILKDHGITSKAELEAMSLDVFEKVVKAMKDSVPKGGT